MVDSDRLFDLSGKVIVITGAVGLLGREHAEAVARAGGTPVLLDIHEDGAKALAAELQTQHSVEATGWYVDITSEENVAANCVALLSHYGRIDGLINNAANNPKVEENSPQEFSRLEQFPLDAWHNDLAVGLTGAFLCAKHYGTAIVATTGGQGGSIVNISSDLGLVAPDQRLYLRPNLPPDQQPVKPVTYSVVKTGLIGLTRYLATYWADKGVRCNALCPGGVENGQDPAFLAEVTARIPLGRMALPNEYHGSLLFLLSSASSYVTGSVLVADGGRTCW
jgi:NAD(P)-dependent dehydrogenase (short-subunit alcohol dehydrogenase family)